MSPLLPSSTQTLGLVPAATHPSIGKESCPVTRSLLPHTRVENVAASGHFNCRNLS
ncbi:hypothetical protein BD309DRAFT_952167 [Dichomitus squalens]|nr:hypothetical protein BD309DRAFT_952167 [Dichomitus squalens]